MVDHLGLLISAQVSAANVGDRAGLAAMLYLSKNQLPKTVYVDQGYSEPEMIQEGLRHGVEIVTVPRRSVKAFVLDARRWIVERTLAWLGKCRRLSKDYELVLSSSLSMIYLAMIRLMLRRISLMN